MSAYGQCQCGAESAAECSCEYDREVQERAAWVAYLARWRTWRSDQLARAHGEYTEGCSAGCTCDSHAEYVRLG